MRKITIIGLTILAGFIHISATVLFYQEAGQVLTRDIQIQEYFEGFSSFGTVGSMLPTMEDSCEESSSVTSSTTNKKSQDIQPLIEKELLKDGLIKDVENYKYKLSKKSFKINDKKQPAAIHHKYIALYESLSGIKMSDRQTYAVAVNSH